MDRTFWQFVGGMIVLFLAAVMARVVFSDIDWKGETPAAWLQAIGGFLAVAVASYVGWSEHRRAIEAERAKVRERAQRHARLMRTTLDVCDRALASTDSILNKCRLAPPSDVVALFLAWGSRVSRFADQVDQLRGLSDDPETIALMLVISDGLRSEVMQVEPTEGRKAFVVQYLEDSREVIAGRAELFRNHRLPL